MPAFQMFCKSCKKKGASTQNGWKTFSFASEIEILAILNFKPVFGVVT